MAFLDFSGIYHEKKFTIMNYITSVLWARPVAKGGNVTINKRVCIFWFNYNMWHCLK